MQNLHYRVAVVGATGMVGQRFVTLLEGHPWFTPSPCSQARAPRARPMKKRSAINGR